MACRNLRVTPDIIEIGSEFGIVTNWNLNQAHIASCGSDVPATPGAIYNSPNLRRQPIKHLVRSSARFGDCNRIKKNCDAGVSRREFNDAGNGGIAKLFKCAQDFVQGFLRRVLESLTHAHDERGISERNGFSHSIIPSEVEESRGTTGGSSMRFFDFAALCSG